MDPTISFRRTPFVDDRTAGFTGRLVELACIKNWLTRRSHGYLLLLGAPGVGKSALMAMLTDPEALGRYLDEITEADLPRDRPTEWPPAEWPERERGAWLDVWREEFKRVVAQVDLFRYFIRVPWPESRRPSNFLRIMIGGLARTPQPKQDEKTDLAALQRKFASSLKEAAADRCARGRKLVLVVDGLDEALPLPGETLPRTILDCLPTELSPGVFMLLSSRPRAEVCDGLFGERGTLDRERRETLLVGGLGSAEIRAMLAEAWNRYELTPEFVDEVQRTSGGNPLYVTYLIADLVAGWLDASRLDTLPRNLTEMYEKIVDRFQDQPAARAVVAALAAAGEPLTAHQVAGIESLDVGVARDALVRVCADVLWRTRRNAVGDETFEVYHWTFAEFLAGHGTWGKEVADRKTRILAYAVQEGGGPSATQGRQEVGLFEGDEALDAPAAPLVERILDGSSRLLAARRLLLDHVARRSFADVAPLLRALARSARPAPARFVEEVVVSGAAKAPPECGRFLVSLVADAMRHDETGEAADVERQAARVGLEAAATLAGQGEPVASHVRAALLAGCRHRDDAIRAFAVLAVVRAATGSAGSYDLALDIVRELGRGAVTWGVLRPSRTMPLVGTALSLYFERTGDDRLNADLLDVVRKTLRRVIGLRSAAWLGAGLVERFFNAMPGDYNPVNLFELRQTRDVLRRQPHLTKLLGRVIDFIDPAHGHDADLPALLREVYPSFDDVEAGFLTGWPVETALIARGIARPDVVLPIAFEVWKRAKDSGHHMSQDLFEQVCVIERGRAQRGDPPPPAEWTELTERALEHYFMVRGGCFCIAKPEPYVAGGLVPGLAFLARRTANPQLPCLERFARHACGLLREKRRPGTADCGHSSHMVLLRALEVNAVEYGIYDSDCLKMGLFGLQCFLAKPNVEALDDETWTRIATILARVRTFFPERTDQFLLGLTPDVRHEVELRMAPLFANEGIGTLIGVRSEVLFTAMLAEPPDKTDGLRARWQEFLRLLVSPASVTQVLRKVAAGVLRMLMTVPTDTAPP